LATSQTEDKKHRNPPKKARSRLRFGILDKALLVVIPLGLAIWGIWVCPRLSILPQIIINDYTPYLLSAIAQSLAAVLALVFTISLIAAQLSTRYSHRVLAGFFDAPTIAYMLLFIIAVILPFWLLTEPSIHGIKGSLILATVCLVLLVPYFLGFRKRIIPERVLLDLTNHASEQLLADPNTEPASLAMIDDITTQALASRDYGTFGKGIQALGELLYQAEKLYSQAKKGFKFEDVSRVSNRLDSIAVNTMEDDRAREYLNATLWKIAGYSTNDGLGWTTVRLVREFYRLSLKAMEKGLKDAAAEYVSLLHIVGNLGMLRGIKDLTIHEVTLLLHHAGVEAAKRSMDLPLERAVSCLGEIGGDCIDKDMKESAKEVALYLGNIGLEAGRNGLIKQAEQASYWLIHLGKSAISKLDVDLRIEAKKALKNIEESADATVINSAFLKVKNFSGFHRGYAGTEADLRKFAEFFQRTESDGNENDGLGDVSGMDTA